MSFLVHINNPSKFCLIFGLRPFSIDTNLNRACTNKWITIYSIIHLSALAYFVPFITIKAFFSEHPIQEYLSNMFKIIQYSKLTLCIFIFDIQLCLAIINRHRHVKFLNCLCAMDEKFTLHFGTQTITSKLNGNLNWPIVVTTIYWLILCTILLIYIESTNIYKITHRCCIAITAITMT